MGSYLGQHGEVLVLHDGGSVGGQAALLQTGEEVVQVDAVDGERSRYSNLCLHCFLSLSVADINKAALPLLDTYLITLDILARAVR